MHWQTARFRIDLDAPARDGHRQRHARFVLRRRPLRRDARGAARTASSCWRRAPTSSTSAANRPGPGAAPVPLEEELARVLPVLRDAVTLGVPVSVDTCKPEVMRAALDLGADMVNDI